jgi:hypothetical protein
LLSLDLFQTFAATSIVGGTAAHQWAGNFLVTGQITSSIPELERKSMKFKISNYHFGFKSGLLVTLTVALIIGIGGLKFYSKMRRSGNHRPRSKLNLPKQSRQPSRRFKSLKSSVGGLKFRRAKPINQVEA